MDLSLFFVVFAMGGGAVVVFFFFSPLYVGIRIRYFQN